MMTIVCYLAISACDEKVTKSKRGGSFEYSLSLNKKTGKS